MANERSFPTRVIPDKEWLERVKAAGVVYIPESTKVVRHEPWARERTGWGLHVFHTAFGRGGVSVRRVEIVRTVWSEDLRPSKTKTTWSKGPLTDVDQGGLPGLFTRTLEVLFDGELPPLGSTVSIAGDEVRGVVDRVAAKTTMRDDTERANITNLGLYVSGKTTEGKLFCAPLETVTLVDTPLTQVDELLAFAPGQPVFSESGKSGRIEKVERGKFGGVRLLVKLSGHAESWCNLDDVRVVSGWTPMHSAALRDDPFLVQHWPIEQVDAVLEQDAVVGLFRQSRNMPSKSTPLHVAAQFARMEAFEALLKRGADLEAEDDRGNTPFAMVTRQGGAAWAMQAGYGERMAAMALKQQNLVTLGDLADAGFDLDQSIDGGRSVRDALDDPKFLHNDPSQVTRILTLGAARCCPHAIKPSQSSKTKCKHCRKKILKGEPMFGVGEVTPQQTVSRTWLHLDCARRAFPDEVRDFEDQG